MFGPQMLLSELQGAPGKRQRLVKFPLIIQRDNLSAETTGFVEIRQTGGLLVSVARLRNRLGYIESRTQTNQRQRGAIEPFHFNFLLQIGAQDELTLNTRAFRQMSYP